MHDFHNGDLWRSSRGRSYPTFPAIMRRYICHTACLAGIYRIYFGAGGASVVIGASTVVGVFGIHGFPTSCTKVL